MTTKKITALLVYFIVMDLVGSVAEYLNLSIFTSIVCLIIVFVAKVVYDLTEDDDNYDPWDSNSWDE